MTRKVDDLVRAMGLAGMDKSVVSHLAKGLDEQVERFRQRPLEGNYPYMWLDATYLKVREDGRVQGMALVVAIGVRETGERKVLGVDLGPAEDAEFWLGFLRSLVARGLHGLKLVISDAHEGLKRAIGTTLDGAAWQRCTVHFMRNSLSHMPKTAQPMVAAAIRTICIWGSGCKRTLPILYVLRQASHPLAQRLRAVVLLSPNTSSGWSWT